MLRNPYFHIIFRLHLIKQIFEEKKLLRALYESQTQFWPKITPEGVGLNGRDFIAKKNKHYFQLFLSTFWSLWFNVLYQINLND